MHRNGMGVHLYNRSFLAIYAACPFLYHIHTCAGKEGKTGCVACPASTIGWCC